MALSEVTKRNVHRDRRVLGRNWSRVYGNYFSDERVLRSFVDLSSRHLEALPKKPKILYVCSGTGLLGERVVEHLRKRGKMPSLTIVDASEAQLSQNTNPATHKVLGDLLRLHLHEKFDLVIMRSSLDYFHTPALQVAALKRVKAHMANGGIFINQCAALPTLAERNLANAIYSANPKIGKRHFQSIDLPALYTRAGLDVEKLGAAPQLFLSSSDHVLRYGLSLDEVAKIQRLIASTPAAKRPSIKIASKSYKLTFDFPIYVARKK